MGLATAASACRAELTEKMEGYTDAAQRAALAEAQAQAAKKDASEIHEELAAAHAHAEDRSAQIRMMRARLMDFQAEHRAFWVTGPPNWQEGHGNLVAKLGKDRLQLTAHLADRQRLNQCLMEDMRALREASGALFELGDQQTRGLAAVRSLNDELVSEMERVTREIAKLEPIYWKGVPFRGVEKRELEQLRRNVVQSDLKIAKLEKDVACAQQFTENAESDTWEASARKKAAHEQLEPSWRTAMGRCLRRSQMHGQARNASKCHS